MQIRSKKTNSAKVTGRDKLLPALTLAFFNRPRLTALLWLSITIFGIVSYTTLLKREGFPSVAIPIVIVNGTYGVNDPAKVDTALATPISELALKQAGVKSVSSESAANFVSVTIQYSENTNTTQAKQALQAAIDADAQIPKTAKLILGAPNFGVTGPSFEKVDATVSVYSTQPATTLQDLTVKASRAAEYLQSHKSPQVARYFVSQPFQTVINPATKKAVIIQKSFDRYGERSKANGATAANNFRQSVVINVASTPGADVIKLDAQIRNSLGNLQSQPEFQDIHTAVSASYAPAIKAEISELQRVLLEGLLAVLVVGSLIIAVRAALITILSMLTVIASTIGLLYLFGYSLNVITLFGLILGLALIVDDTIIMVEAIDSARRSATDSRQALYEATRKISRAMIAATLTAALSFTPLLFVGGILGSFIRAIPVTIIAALLISLVVALVFIPLFARWLLLGKNQIGTSVDGGGARRFEASLAQFIIRPMLWARHSRIKEFSIGILALVIGFGFIGAGGYVFQKVAFNIFPPSKDTNQLAVKLTFPSGTTVAAAQATTEKADSITSRILGSNLREASYYGTADERSALLTVALTPYGSRTVTAPQLAAQIKSDFKSFAGAQVTAYPIDAGPPASAFKVKIDASQRAAANLLAADMAKYLEGLKLTRTSGTQATMVNSAVSNSGQFLRTAGRPIVTVSAGFDASDTTTLTTLAQAAIKQHYDQTRLSTFGLKTADISFDIGQESENQNSFKSLAFAFPLVLLAIYILLVIQFRSLLQPLLIFMALPFSFFGIALGLYYTDNAFSFFSMLGFFALIGLSIKNTILLTDYANQARRAGLPAVDAVAAALGERFRPLIATSLTAVVSLIPLALTSPFWQSLAVTLIFGLLSSTFLVITVFPYYYLGAEYARERIPGRAFAIWVALNAAIVAGAYLVGTHDLQYVGLVAIILNTVLYVGMTARSAASAELSRSRRSHKHYRLRR